MDGALEVTLTPPGDNGGKVSLSSVSSFLGGIPHAVVSLNPASAPVTFGLVASEADIRNIAPNLQETVPPTGAGHQRLKADAIEDIFIVCHYSVSYK